MTALKVFVAVMGVLILAATTLLVVVIVGRLSHSGSGAGAAPPFAAAAIDIPAGARIEAMSVGPDRLVLDLILADGNRQLVIIDLATGHRLGTIPLRAAP